MAASTAAFQIPNNPGQTPLGFAVKGVSTFNSASLNETQNEVTVFAVLSLQKHVDQGDLQISVFNRTSTLSFTARLARRSVVQWHRATGRAAGRGDRRSGRRQLEDQRTAHAARGLPRRSSSRPPPTTTSSVLPVDATGTPTTDVPLTIIDNQNNSGGLYGVYVQDEWKLTPTLTLNYGLRFDVVEEFTHESQLSPRVNLVWKPIEGRPRCISATRAISCRRRMRR